MSSKTQDNPKLNRELVGAVEEAISACHESYYEKAKSFAVILNELEVILHQFQTKMQLEETTAGYAPALQTKTANGAQTEQVQEKLVYVRLFHKDMKNLRTPTGSLAFIRPLLESIKMADKHGLAVYANEEEVKRSLKGECYAYATIKIRPDQDITEKRGTRIDPNIGCTLLTITNIHISNILKLTYNNIDFMIKDSMIVRPE